MRFRRFLRQCFSRSAVGPAGPGHESPFSRTASVLLVVVVFVMALTCTLQTSTPVWGQQVQISSNPVAIPANGEQLVAGRLVSSPDAPFPMGELSLGYAASSQLTGAIRGRVVDQQTGEALSGAAVSVVGTSIGAATDDSGNYRITGVPEGEQTLRISYIGYRTEEVTVFVESGQTLEQRVELTPDMVEGQEVIVSAQALGQAGAIQRQLASNSIVNVVSAARLREMPDANAAESIGRLPGVSVLRDAGEGQKVAVRGLGPEYSAITIDGNRVPGTSDDRSVDLSMISPDMLSGIEVYKTIRPDMDADAIGGTVNFRMGAVPSEARYSLKLESGYSSHINDVGTYKATAGASRRVWDDRIGFMLSLNAQQVDRSSHVLGSSYEILRDAREDEPHAPVEVRSLNLIDRYEIRRRYGGGLTVDFNVLNGRVVLNNTYSRQDRDEDRFERRYDLNSNRQSWRVRDSDRAIYTLNNSLSGEHDFDWAGIDWRISRSVSSNDTPYNHQTRFDERSAMDQTEVDLSRGPEVLPAMARNRMDEVFLQSLSNQLRDERQEDLSGSLDIEIPVSSGRYVNGYVKFGGKHYSRFRERNSTGFRVWDWTLEDLYNYENSTFPWELMAGGRGLAKIDPFIPDMGHSYFILNDQYEIAFMPDLNITNQLWRDYSHRYRPQLSVKFQDYDATERLSAGYAMMELNVGRKLMILPGVRYEYEHSEYTAAMVGAFRQQESELTYEQQNQFQDSTDTRHMGMLFPMVQARYHVTDWLDVRAARTESTTRPSFHNLTPRYRLFDDDGEVFRGNTQIRPMRAVNYDLFLTLHSNRIGLYTIGGFYKEVHDLIYVRNANIIDPEEEGLPPWTRLFRIEEPANNENLTRVHGFEMEWQSSLIFLPRPFNGLVINANYTRLFSEAHYQSFEFQRTAQGIVGVDTFRVAPMVHQADHLANVSIGYDYRGFSSRVSVQYQGGTLRQIGSRPEKDRFTDDYVRVDATVRQRIWGGRAHIIANLHNLTNREDRSSQFTRDRPLAIEFYGASFDLGVELRF